MTDIERLYLCKLLKVDFNKSVYITHKEYVYETIDTTLENISIIKTFAGNKKGKCHKTHRDNNCLSIIEDCTIAQ